MSYQNVNVVKKDVKEPCKPSTSGLLNDVMMPNIRFVGVPADKPSVIDLPLDSGVGVDSVFVNQVNSPLDEITHADREIDLYRQLIEDNNENFSFSGIEDTSCDILDQLIRDLDDMEGIDTVD